MNSCSLRKLLCTVLFVSTTTLQLISADLDRVIFQKDPVPGFENYEIRYVGPIAIGPNGHIVAWIQYWDEEFNTRTVLAYIPQVGEPPQKLIGDGDSAIGVSGGFFSYFAPQSAVASDGTVMLTSSFQTSPSDSHGALITGTPGQMKASVVAGTTHPSIGGGVTVRSFVGKMNHSAEVAYWAEFTGASPSDRVFTIFKGPAGGESLLYRTGQFYPGLPPESTLTDIDDIWFNNDGEVTFVGEVTIGNKKSRGIWKGTGGSLTEIMRSGEPAVAANLPGGYTWYNPTILSNADNGLVSFRVGLDDGEGGIFLAEGTNITRVLKDPSSAPGTGNAMFDTNYSGFPLAARTTFSLSSTGRGILKSRLEEGTGTPAVDNSNNFGLWEWNGSALELLLRSSDQAPGYEEGTLFGGLNSIGFNEDGRVIIGGDTGSFTYPTVWGEVEPQQLSIISQVGSSLEISEGQVVPIQWNSLINTNPSNGSDGGPMHYNGLGQVLLDVAEEQGDLRGLALAQIGRLPTPGRVAGYVRNDEDGDGDLEDADSGIDDVLVELFQESGGQPTGSSLASDGTDSSGYFSMDDIEPGSYILKQTNRPGFRSTGDSDGDDFDLIQVTIISGGSSEDNLFLDQIDPDAPLPSLDNQAMNRLEANAIINVPVNPEFASLNLAQCVLLTAYEWRRQSVEVEPERVDMAKTEWANQQEMEALTAHYEDRLEQAGFFFPEAKAEGMKTNLRNMWSRMRLTRADVQMLHGMMRQMVRWKERGD